MIGFSVPLAFCTVLMPARGKSWLYCTFIGGNDRVLVFSQGGQWTLLKADTDKMEIISQIEMFTELPATERDLWSHPALVGNRLYIRTLSGVYCYLIDQKW